MVKEPENTVGAREGGIRVRICELDWRYDDAERARSCVRVCVTNFCLSAHERQLSSTLQ